MAQEPTKALAFSRYLPVLSRRAVYVHVRPGVIWKPSLPRGGLVCRSLLCLFLHRGVNNYIMNYIVEL